MCGICGYAGNRIDDRILNQMNDSLYYRGPDDAGVMVFETAGKAVGLAHRRLSILDLSDSGHQPMISQSGKTAIVFNGEIYNFNELKLELINKGYHFCSRCDTEVVLYSYEEWGINCFNKFNGMFAVAVFDRTVNKIILARDRFGKKPLYYYNNKEQFIFASELKPLMLHPLFEKNIDNLAVSSYFCNKYIPAPSTIFENTFKVKAGQCIVYDCCRDEITEKAYYDISGIFNKAKQTKNICDIGTAIDQLDNILQESVRKRLISDVPVGVFLSGGIDSSLVAAVAQKVGDGFDSFTVGFYDREKDEAPKARKIAKYVGTKHHEVYISDDDALSLVTDIAQYYDEPFADDSQIPSMLVSRFASNYVKVVLSGDGGDELFCGYKWYDLEWIVQHLDFMGLALSKLPFIGGLTRCFPPLHAFLNNQSNIYKTQLFTDVFLENANRILLNKYGVEQIKFPYEKLIETDNLQERRMVLDMMTYLPDEILCKMDRASMMNSIELRCPLLDYNLLEWSFGLSHNLKYNMFRKKYLLKKLAYKYVPRELLEGPKRGFSVPKHRWLREVFHDEIMEMSLDYKIKGQGIFDFTEIHKLIDNQEKSDNIVYTSQLWSFYIFQKWYEKYM